MKKEFKTTLYSLLLVLCAYLAMGFNQWGVLAIHSFAGLRVTQGNANEKNMQTPDAFIASVADALTHSTTLSEADKAVVVGAIPTSLDYEYSHQAPYENVFDFSVFDLKNKQGGILLLGDSTISWGFSVNHFAAMAQVEVHALTFGRNTMDAVLLAATDRIIECYYANPPTVMISNSLTSVSLPSRLNRRQDRAIGDIARTENCEQLDELVNSNRPKEPDQLKLSESLDFRNYRAMIAQIGPGIGRLRHVRLHEIMEPEKFEETGRVDLYFYRWQPEFRIPFRRNSEYLHWRAHESGKTEEFLDRYLRQYGDGVESVAASHRSWADRDACFIQPLTLSPESAVRELFFPAGSFCRLDFNAIAQADAASMQILMLSGNHQAASGGVVFAAIVGKTIRGKRFPTWRRM